MWIANLYRDKGGTLASFIIASNFKSIPDAIYLKRMKDITIFGGVCPKLKAIISKYQIRLKEGDISYKELHQLRLK